MQSILDTLKSLAAFHDEQGNAHLAEHKTFSVFDEPDAVQKSRATLSMLDDHRSDIVDAMIYAYRREANNWRVETSGTHVGQVRQYVSVRYPPAEQLSPDGPLPDQLAEYQYYDTKVDALNYIAHRCMQVAFDAGLTWQPT